MRRRILKASAIFSLLTTVASFSSVNTQRKSRPHPGIYREASVPRREGTCFQIYAQLHYDDTADNEQRKRKRPAEDEPAIVSDLKQILSEILTLQERMEKSEKKQEESEKKILTLQEKQEEIDSKILTLEEKQEESEKKILTLQENQEEIDSKILTLEATIHSLRSLSLERA
jgi:peptidoglycan hydrolase CwlO-like protein